jgi:hypothetical protein
VPWEDWVKAVVEAEPAARRRAKSWFWTMHDTLANLEMWSQHIVPDQVHVITVPRPGSAETLWARFASVLGIDPESADVHLARSNASLGLVEAEFLRRLNAALPADIPDWFYKRHIKQAVDLGALSVRPGQPRLILPPDLQPWAAEQAEILVAGLQDSKYHIVGDLDELLPLPPTGPYAAPEASKADELLTAAVQGAAALTDWQYRERSPAKPKHEPRGRPGAAARRLVWNVLNGPQTRRALHKLSHRRAARQLQIQIYRLLMRPASRRR